MKRPVQSRSDLEDLLATTTLDLGVSNVSESEPDEISLVLEEARKRAASQAWRRSLFVSFAVDGEHHRKGVYESAMYWGHGHENGFM
ncbi:hypothetical protein Pmar_PMAR016142 [Perkinsus marinus ATCC 50983]|uniref:Uncharacterized protein n=1 Tax=Perkinsus marinus (strain ATCC 50983 / TXsc) TaxID=423536 RepID=C5LZ55_PERM5|nr:hypothetical protein Pmar_PMAR016142 [Perkinsus marinus ATCC 50983]EEQ98064.1 hypothetical protein Pmar_PMAR016142 [Perkinsus marinus ATCC 50983]|eukprot:XP_002765347.1 hypothetical protein Pmar_PMAR016142 [Perkinsus marinus ATCC 50983]